MLPSAFFPENEAQSFLSSLDRDPFNCSPVVSVVSDMHTESHRSARTDLTDLFIRHITTFI